MHNDLINGFYVCKYAKNSVYTYTLFKLYPGSTINVNDQSWCILKGDHLMSLSLLVTLQTWHTWPLTAIFCTFNKNVIISFRVSQIITFYTHLTIIEKKLKSSQTHRHTHNDLSPGFEDSQSLHCGDGFTVLQCCWVSAGLNFDQWWHQELMNTTKVLKVTDHTTANPGTAHLRSIRHHDLGTVSDGGGSSSSSSISGTAGPLK